MTKQPYVILVAQAVKSSLIQSVQRLRAEHPELGEPQIVLLTTDPEKYQHYAADVMIVPCDFEPETLRRVIADITDRIAGVVVRGDAYVQYLRKLVPYLPSDVPVSSEASLQVATNKRLMREVFERQCPDNTPRHVQVTTADATIGELSFPVIVKPASLASSVMIQKCDTADELRSILAHVFAELQATYGREGRSEPPEVIVEEYLEGDFYSIDSYIVQPGEVYHTPLVYYVPAKQLGIDDFFLYKRTLPVDLPEEAVQQARRAAENAIAAAGLQYTSVHTELVRVGDGSWKIIEIGPRLGRFRAIMYREACGIDHSYNDLLTRCGLRPNVTPVQRAFCAAYSIYPEREGVLREIRNIQAVREHIQGVVYEKDMSKPGMPARYARNGGHALYEVIFRADTAGDFAADSAWFEANVHAVTDGAAEQNET